MTALECAQLKELWKERIEDFRASGLSGREWCAQQGVKVDRLHYWNRKLQATDADASAATWVTLDTARGSDPDWNPTRRHVQISGADLQTPCCSNNKVRPQRRTADAQFGNK